MTSVQCYLIQIWKGYTCVLSPADMVGHPAKVTWLTAFFLRNKAFFVRLLSRLSAGRPVGWHMYSSININTYMGIFEY